MTDLIGTFLERYSKEYDYYSQAGLLVERMLDADLKAAGVRAIVTSRAKAISRLEDKCRKRAETRDYQTVEDIYEDIVDLAGVRVALYFPAERDQVEKVISRLFRVLAKKEFPEGGPIRVGKRFSGYSALHFRINLKEEALGESERRYSSARVEIQVASVLMHAWSEVEHDLAYKPLEGRLSDVEYAILDQLNGLVLAGEIGLENLQKAGEARVTRKGIPLTTHYDLASLLIGQASSFSSEPITDSGLGRVDLLFRLLRELHMNTSDQLKPYIESLHGNVEERPLADQVIDALLAEDQARYSVYEKIRQEMYPSASTSGVQARESHAAMGAFLEQWIKLERIVRDIELPDSSGVDGVVRRRPFILSASLLERVELRPY